jgi:dethiobiotin synthetase
MSAVFLTATGTDIGKTFVTAGLIRTLRAHRRKACALKPVISGFDVITAESSDTGILLRAMERPITPETVAALSPWRFRAPLSPDMAAARESRVIDFEELITFCRKEIAAADGALFIEGVGGVMVPLGAQHTVLDWIAALKIPTLLVAGTYLGTISHTLTAFAALASRGIAVRAIVLNESENSPVPVAETMRTIGRFAPVIPITAIPRAGDLPALQAAFGQLCAHVE